MLHRFLEASASLTGLLLPDRGTTASADLSSDAVVPDDLLFRGQYENAGGDLLISGVDGEKFALPGYFRSKDRPNLQSADGAVLAADVVDILAGANHAQYAQTVGESGRTPIGRVEMVAGMATATRNGAQIILQVSDRVFKQDVIATGANSSCAISFLDGSAFNLSANCRMVLNEMIYEPAANSNLQIFNLVAGAITFASGQVAKTGEMKVTTPAATMGIRGTICNGVVEEELGMGGRDVTRLIKLISLDHSDGTRGKCTLLDPSGNVLGETDLRGVQLQLRALRGQYELTRSSVSNDVLQALQVEALRTEQFGALGLKIPLFEDPGPGGPGGGGSSTPIDLLNRTSPTLEPINAPLGSDPTLRRAVFTPLEVEGGAFLQAAPSPPPPIIVNTAPPAPGAVVLAQLADTGLSNTDGLTNDNTFELILSGQESGSSVAYEVSVNGGAFTPTTAGQSELADGIYQFRAVVTNSAGSATTNPVMITVDTTAPQAPTMDIAAPSAPTEPAAAGTSTVALSGANVIANNTLTFAGTAEAGSIVRIYATQNGVTTLIATEAAVSGTYNITASALSDGTYAITSTATDEAGNESAASQVLSVTIDTVAPGAVTIDLDAISDSGASDTDNVTKDTTPTLTLTAEAGSTVRVYNEATLLGTASETTAGSFSFTPATNLMDGSYLFTARATDEAGNESAASQALSLRIDTKPPSLTINAIAVDDRLNRNEAKGALVISGTAEGIEAGQLVSVTVAGFALPGKTYKAAVDDANKWTLTIPAADVAALDAVNGTYTVQANLSDLAGNLADEATRSLIVDTTAPTVSVDIVEDWLGESRTSSVVTFTFSEAPGLSFNESDILTTNAMLRSGSLQAVEGSATQFTAIVDLAVGSSGAVTVGIAQAAYEDLATNPGAKDFDAVPIGPLVMTFDAGSTGDDEQTYTENGLTVSAVELGDTLDFSFGRDYPGDLHLSLIAGPSNPYRFENLGNPDGGLTLVSVELARAEGTRANWTAYKDVNNDGDYEEAGEVVSVSIIQQPGIYHFDERFAKVDYVIHQTIGDTASSDERQRVDNLTFFLEPDLSSIDAGPDQPGTLTNEMPTVASAGDPWAVL
jgi:Bacterial Ig-like domain/FecR protein